MAMLVTFGVTAGSTQAFADSDFTGMPDDMKKVVKDNYWAELEYKSNNPIPKYLMTPEESSLKGIDFSTNDDKSFFSNTGIRADRAGVLDVLGGDYMGNYLIPAYKMIADNPSFLDTDEVKKQFNVELYKAFNMDVKTNFPLDKDKDQFVYGDIAVNDDTQHDKVASLTKSNDVKLKFSLDTSNVKKVLNAVLLWNHSANTGFNDDWKNAVYDSDIDFVFVLDLPKGVTVDDNTTYAFSGLEGFTVTHKLDKQRLVVHARKNRSTDLQTLKKAFETINKLNEVALTISKVKIEDSVETEKNLTITGYAYGAYDSVYGNNSGVITNRDMSKKKDNDYINRTYHMMAAMQSETGRDSAADKTKPNLISYSFKVKKADAKEERDREPRVLYRLYNPYTHEHFFTAETVENDNLVRLGWKSEGGVGYIYKHAEKGGVYRLYNPTTGEHHYTTKEDEVAQCVKAGWKNEGVKWFSAQNKEVTLNKLYSMYNPYEKKFYHHYTADAKEIAQMVKAGWRKEEVKWCTLPVSYIIKK